MTIELYPNDDDQLALLEAQRILAASGVAAPSAGYDLTTLAAAVYQAEIRPQRDGANQPLGIKSGWTADVALAFALAQAILRQAERSGQSLSLATKIGNVTPTS